MCRQRVGRTYVREKAMQKPHDDKVCATVRILPSEYPCDHLCDFDVVPGYHPSYRATMLRGKLNQLKEMIQKSHRNLEVSQTESDGSVIITLSYQPGYFNAQRPIQDFQLWIEGLWRRGLADYHKTMREQVKKRARC